jgi:hypothetical protein
VTVPVAAVLLVTWATLEAVAEVMIEESLRADFGRGPCALFEAVLVAGLGTAFDAVLEEAPETNPVTSHTTAFRSGFCPSQVAAYDAGL